MTEMTDEGARGATAHEACLQIPDPDDLIAMTMPPVVGTATRPTVPGGRASPRGVIGSRAHHRVPALVLHAAEVAACCTINHKQQSFWSRTTCNDHGLRRPIQNDDLAHTP